MNIGLKVGNFLFRYRSFTPIPIIILVFLLFKPNDLGDENIFINIGGLLISFLGESIRLITVGYSFPGTSGRETHLRADALNTTGIYSIVRNPLYIGNFFMFTGLVTVFANLYALLVFALFLIVQYYFIIISEENFLKGKYGNTYTKYCSLVKRLIPTFRNYKTNRNPFNLKKVIFKENDSIFNMLLMFLLLLFYKEKAFTGIVIHPFVYIIPGGILILFYIMVKVFKKKKTIAK